MDCPPESAGRWPCDQMTHLGPDSFLQGVGWWEAWGLGGRPVGSSVSPAWTQPSSRTPRRGCFSAFPLPGRPPNLVPAMPRLEGDPEAQWSPDAPVPPSPVSLGSSSGPWAQAGTMVGQGRLGPAGSSGSSAARLSQVALSFGEHLCLGPPLPAPLFPTLSSEGPGTVWSTQLPGFL